MEDRLCFVQFLHPGGEPDIRGESELAWNTRKLHKRKFLRARGRYITSLDAEPAEADVGLWGEWEPQSRTTPIFKSKIGEPSSLHVPFYDPPEKGAWAQNTDPFVFGDHFHFTGCQQHSHVGNRTQLARLRPGSVVLFGSGKSGRFTLDTVFVVGARWIDHSRDTLDCLDGEISDAYREITIDRWYAAGGLPAHRLHRLYFGARYGDRIGDMFSFFPCVKLEDPARGFVRPEIKLPGSITPTQTQRYKLTYLTSTAQAAELWGRVVEQVLDADLALGVRAELPPRRSGEAWNRDIEAVGCAAD